MNYNKNLNFDQLISIFEILQHFENNCEDSGPTVTQHHPSILSHDLVQVVQFRVLDSADLSETILI